MRQRSLLRVLSGAAAAILATVLGLAVSSGPASADHGDGYIECNSGEICLNADYPDGNLERQFWYGGYDNGYWVSRSTQQDTNIWVKNSASSLRNRDTVCDIFEVDYIDSSRVGSEWFTHGGYGAAYYIGFDSNINDQNDAHWRCYEFGT